MVVCVWEVVDGDVGVVGDVELCVGSCDVEECVCEEVMECFWE